MYSFLEDQHCLRKRTAPNLRVTAFQLYSGESNQRHRHPLIRRRQEMGPDRDCALGLGLGFGATSKIG